MLFTEPTFLFLFLPILLALYFVTIAAPARRTYGNWLLLVASVIFYAKGGGAFTWLMLGSIAFNYWMAIAIDRMRGRARASKRLLAFAVAVNLVVLGVFKYANFFADNVNALLLVLRVQPVVVPRVLLPIGISFFTFHAISYVVDVYRRDAVAQKSPVHAALYLLLFPQLIAGPIIRYRDIADQLARRTVGLEDFAYGVRRFVIGLGKEGAHRQRRRRPGGRDLRHAGRSAERRARLARRRLLHAADLLRFLRLLRHGDRPRADVRLPLSGELPLALHRRDRAGVLAALAHLAVDVVPRLPLRAARRQPRVAPARMYRNLVTVFFLCGLWHGASWNFVIWGLFHGTFLVVERLGLAGAVKRAVGAAPPRVSAARRDGRLGVLPRRHAAGRGGVPRGDGWPKRRGAGAVHRAVVSDARAVARADGGRDRIDAGRAGARAVARSLARGGSAASGLAWSVSAAGTATLALLLVASIMQMAARTYNPFIYFRF